MLLRWPVQYASYMQMSRLRVPPTRPPSGRGTPPAAAPLSPLSAQRPLTFGSINRRAYYTMRCVPGSMEKPAAKQSATFFGSPLAHVVVFAFELPLPDSCSQSCSSSCSGVTMKGYKLFMLHLSCCCTHTQREREGEREGEREREGMGESEIVSGKQREDDEE